jgi:DNA-binding XRE family transcriptional regulator
MGRPKGNLIKTSDNTFCRLRKKSQLTQENLARVIGVAVSTIRRWEKNKCEPTMTVEQLRLFCKTVMIDFNRLPKSLIQQSGKYDRFLLSSHNAGNPRNGSSRFG